VYDQISGEPVHLPRRRRRRELPPAV
jgi:hypothetical protein